MNWFQRLFHRKSQSTGDGSASPHSPVRQPDTTTSSQAPLQWIGGRLVLKADPYMLPKDLTESNRLDFQHYMLKHALGGRNFLAPIGQPQAILDIGCGTGRWAGEIARQFPSANVIGVDLVVPNANQAVAEIEKRPDNLVFTEGNIIKGLSFADQSFDFVHMRLLYSAIPAAAWPEVVSELARLTSRGGWIEMVEAASVQNRGPAVDQMNTWVVDACRLRGLDMTIGPHIGEMLQTADLAQVVFRELSLPVGNYGGRLGTMLETDIVAILKAVKPLVVSQHITTSEMFDDTLVAWQAEANQWQMTFPFYFAYGQKA